MDSSFNSSQISGNSSGSGLNNTSSDFNSSNVSNTGAQFQHSNVTPDDNPTSTDPLLPENTQPLLDFVMQLDNANCVIPDAIALYYLRKAGFQSDDARLVKLVSLAAQKFISGKYIATDALNYSKMRSGGSSAGGGGGGGASRQNSNEMTLTMDDLNNALAEYGIVLQKPPYYH
ncbi:transcription initiation factor TFIID subunit 10b-like [Convolutriloba macropyga]|uniref:transcription initiation factor TFIID subunit 10b-like n=1 Tax=Convolutriloba macropyga TaxID=536237 RepID=UPI003F51ACBA